MNINFTLKNAKNLINELNKKQIPKECRIFNELSHLEKNIFQNAGEIKHIFNPLHNLIFSIIKVWGFCQYRLDKEFDKDPLSKIEYDDYGKLIL